MHRATSARTPLFFNGKQETRESYFCAPWIDCLSQVTGPQLIISHIATLLPHYYDYLAMAKLLKRRRQRPSTRATSTPVATSTSAPVAEARRSRSHSKFSVPALVRRLLRILRSGSVETPTPNDIESEGVLVFVSHGAVVDICQEAIVAPQPCQPEVHVDETASAPEEAKRGDLASVTGSSGSSLEYADHPGGPVFPIPTTDSEDPETQSLGAHPGPAPMDITVDPLSLSASRSGVTRTPAPSLASVKDEGLTQVPAVT